MSEFQGKVVVITGGTGVLCFPFAKMYSDLGARVAVLGINNQEIDERRKEIEKQKLNIIAINCNVLKKEELIEAKKTINSKLGPIDILINGAGGNSPKGTTDKEYFEIGDIEADTKTFFDLDMDGFTFVFDLNYVGTILPTQVFSTDMIGRDDCSILNISSMNAFTPLTKIPAYSGAKAAVSNLTQWLAVHFSKSNIRVNAIAPGFFVTTQNHSLLFDENDMPTPRSQKILGSTPMNRYGESEELLGATRFLTSSIDASYITGVILPIDGGFSSYSGV